MIQKLIDKTNAPEFYQDCDLKLESYNFKTSDRTFEIILSINQTPTGARLQRVPT